MLPHVHTDKAHAWFMIHIGKCEIFSDVDKNLLIELVSMVEGQDGGCPSIEERLRRLLLKGWQIKRGTVKFCKD